MWLSGLSASQPVNQRVAGSIPSQGKCLGCGPGSQLGESKRQPHSDVSLPLFLPPFPSVNKQIKSLKKVLKSGNIDPLTLLLFKVVLGILCPVYFYMKFRISCQFLDEPSGILIGIAFELMD